MRKKGEVIYEKEWSRPAADRLIEALRRCGFETLDVSPGGGDTPLNDRYTAANDAGADAFISRHYNADSGKWWSPGYTVAFISRYAGKETRRLAVSVQNECAAASGWISEGVQEDYKYLGYDAAVLRRTKMPALITETGFMDVWDQARLILDDEFVRLDSEAACRGICSFFGVNYTPAYENRIFYAVQTGAYTSLENARGALEAAKKAGYPDAYIIEKNTAEGTYVEI